MHRFAKQTFASWLRGGIRVGANFKGLQPLTLNNQGITAPMYNIYEEFPIATAPDLKEIGSTRCCAQAAHAAQAAHPISDEVDWVQEIQEFQEIYQACNHLTAWHCFVATNVNFSVAHKHGIPTAKELSQTPLIKRINFLFDVASIKSDGSLQCVYEICHTNPMEPHKIKWLSDHQIPWFEISAEWIMKQCRSPYSIQEGILRSSNRN